MGLEFLKTGLDSQLSELFFSGNIAIGVVLFVGYLIIGYVIGLITFLLGAVRYIQLRLLFKKIENAVRTKSLYNTGRLR